MSQKDSMDNAVEAGVKRNKTQKERSNDMRQEKKVGGTKRALLTSVLALVLSLAMLAGTTFAWFTDTASTGVNRIVSGNLDVGLEYWDKESGWLDAEDSKDLFDENALWEPGYTQIVYLKVKNGGNLALTYAMQITPVHEQLGINVDGEEFKLSDYIQFGWAVITVGEDDTFQFADRDAARAAVGEGVHLGEELRRQAELPLEADAEELVALVAWMPEDVGNEANYRNVEPSIELSLKVLATQATVESDSFDNMYDEGAVEDELKDLPTYDYTYSELEGIILIPDENGNIVKAIVTAKAGKVPEGYFANGKFAKLSTVEIQDGVTEIGDKAFMGCKALRSVSIPDSVKRIGKMAFYYAGPTTLTLPKGIEEWGQSAFQGGYVRELTVSEGLKEIGFCAFQYCPYLKKVTIPEGTNVGRWAFRASKVEEVEVNGDISGDQAFYNCDSLKKAVMNGKVIGEKAFYNCKNLTTVELGENVTTISDYAFMNSSGLTEIVIPKNVTSIGKRAFASCTKLVSMQLECNATLGSQMFYNCKALTTLTFDESVTKIPGGLSLNYSKNLANVIVKHGMWTLNQKQYTTDESGKLPTAAVQLLIKGYGAVYTA